MMGHIPKFGGELTGTKARASSRGPERIFLSLSIESILQGIHSIVLQHQELRKRKKRKGQ
jgi:hypothetical protein